MNRSPTNAFAIDELVSPRRSMRIAVVTESYPPEVNGVASTVARVVEGLRSRNHSVQLIRPRQGHSEPATQALGLDEFLTKGMPIPGYGSLHMGLPSKRSLVQLWSARRPDVVHIATEGPLGWSALQAARKLKLAVCSDFRTNFHAYSAYYGIGWLQKPIMAYLRKFHNLCDRTMVPTDHLRHELDEHGFHSLSVVARGVDTQLFSPDRRSPMLRRQWCVSDADVVVLYVGRVAAEKNLAVLLRAFQHVRARQPTARLVVVGDGPARKELEARCRQAVFTGVRTGEDLATHYASSDLFLFPSLTETYGNVTPEAMASGLPVVAFNHAAAAHLISDGINGALAPKADAPAFYALASDLACDSESRRRLGWRARERALQLDWDSILLNIEDVYTATITQAKTRHMPRVWAQVQQG